jgi:hypothetical protein
VAFFAPEGHRDGELLLRFEGRLREHAPAASGPDRETTLLYGLLRSDPRPWRAGA